MGIDVAVVGSLNLDLVAVVDRLPGPGETVSGEDVARFDGGKGGNQAVAAARAGAGTAMVACVGRDDAGARAVAALTREGVDTSWVAPVDRPSGVALIAVDRDGANQIVVSPGANAALGADEVHEALTALAPPVVVTCFEVPPAAVVAAAQWCRGSGARLVLNPSPARPVRPGDLPAGGVVVCNEVELGIVAADDGPLDEVAARVARAWNLDVVVTLGGAGALWTRPDGSHGSVPAPAVDPVDTTGAGDCLTGVLGAGLGAGRDLPTALEAAVRAASLSTTAPGARGRP